MKTGRTPLDQYETPPDYVRALLDVIGLPRGVVLEPCAGRGHISDALDHKWITKLVTNDLDPRRPTTWHRDMTDPSSWGELGWDWIITNPPFAHAQTLLVQALTWGKNVAFLARLSFLEPTLTRQRFWRRHAAGLELIVLPRYSFRRNAQGDRQTDSMTCCWLLWRERKDAQRITIAGRRS